MRARSSSLHARAAIAAVALLAAGSSGCASLASSPSWTGGGLAVSAPVREAEAEARAEKERERAAREPREIGAKHILVMHAESKSKPPSVTRSKAEAKKRAQECLLKIRGGEPFDALVKEYSDEPGAADRAGDLGVFEKGTMVKQFADAAFSLKIGEVSEVVETPFGFHIIKRTE
jgi:parvulin-like peptidyl-prolyl isomerase